MIRAVAFDLDGTLVDSREDLAAALNRARRERGLPELPLQAVVEKVGDGARALVERSCGGEVAAAELPAITTRFLALYEPIAVRKTRPYPGVVPLLAGLSRRVPLAVLTNKPALLAHRVLAGLDLARFFSAVVAGDTLAVRKPDPAVVAFVAAALGVPPAALLLVGDSRVDAAAAAAAGSPFALVRWGYTPPREQERLAAVARPRSAVELGRWLGLRPPGA